MAKKQAVTDKIDKVESTEQVETGTQTIELDETVETGDSTKEVGTDGSLGSEETEQEASKCIPGYADALLKLYDTHERLFIDSKGGVYVQPHDGAIEYANPYFIK